MPEQNEPEVTTTIQKDDKGLQCIYLQLQDGILKRQLRCNPP